MTSLIWLIKRLIKVKARVSYHARRWYVHVASAFPLVHHYRAVLAWGSQLVNPRKICSKGDGMPKSERRLFFRENFGYHRFHQTIWLQKKATFPVDTREEVSQKPFFTAVAKVAA
jgi:hypothetical protein